MNLQFAIPLQNLTPHWVALMLRRTLDWGEIAVAVFEFLRVSLVARDQGDLFADKFEPDDRGSKKDFLEEIFSRERWDFEHRSAHFSLLKEYRMGDLLVFRFGRHKLELRHEGPDQHFPLVFSENWDLAWAVFDLTSTSQLFMVQNNIASPKPMVASLFNQIESASLEYPYDFEVEYVSKRSEFWSAAKLHQGKITKIGFSFLPPNALGLSESIKKIIVSAKTQLGAESTAMVHTNKEGGLHPRPEDEYTTAALETISEGGGTVTMKAGRSTIYSSSKNRETVFIDNADLPEDVEDQEGLKLMAEKLKRDKEG